MIELTLYQRAGCHLCDEMKAGVESLSDDFDILLIEIEVGWQGPLAEKYGMFIPVLELNGRELCRYHIDRSAIVLALAAIPQ